MRNKFRDWKNGHPELWEFILFNVLSNCATVTNFAAMWLCTGFVFAAFKGRPFRFFLFNYTTSESLMLCGFLSFLTATALAQTVNFLVQKNFVFSSSVRVGRAVPRYLLLAVLLVVVSAALPAYSQALFAGWGVPARLVPTMANFLNIIVQVALSYPAMKFWVMPQGREKSAE